MRNYLGYKFCWDIIWTYLLTSTVPWFIFHPNSTIPFTFQGLSEYRRRLSVIDRDHQELESELSEWHFRLRAEQRNFLLLAGVKYFIVLLAILAGCFFILGKAANFLFFAIISIFMVAKAEETNKLRYYMGIALACMSMIMELQHYNGLMTFNTGSAIFLVIQFLGFLEII